MDNVYSYEDMAAACGDCKKILEKMKTAIDIFDEATGVYSASIKDKISEAAEKLVDELRDIIDRTKTTIDEMNELMGVVADDMAENEDAGENEVEDI